MDQLTCTLITFDTIGNSPRNTSAILWSNWYSNGNNDENDEGEINLSAKGGIAQTTCPFTANNLGLQWQSQTSKLIF